MLNLVDSFYTLDGNIRNLKGCEQNPEWHPEGDVFRHTCYVHRAMMVIISEMNSVSEIEKEILEYSAIYHDVGKPICSTNENGKIRSHGHDAVGEAITITTLSKHESVTKIASLVRHHMIHCDKKIGQKGVNRLLSKLHVPFWMLYCLCAADMLGRPPRNPDMSNLDRISDIVCDIISNREANGKDTDNIFMLYESHQAVLRSIGIVTKLEPIDFGETL